MSVPTRLCPSRVSGFGLLPTGPFYPRSQGQIGGLATGFITPSTLDVAFREDESQLRKGRASRNPCLLRRMALNLLRPDTAVKTGAAIRHRKTGRNLAGMGARPGPRSPNEKGVLGEACPVLPGTLAGPVDVGLCSPAGIGSAVRDGRLRTFGSRVHVAGAVGS